MMAFFGFGTRGGSDSLLASGWRSSRGEIRCKKKGLSQVLSGDEAPIKKCLALNGLTALTFWGSLEILKGGPGLIGQTILKFTLYVSMLLWLNTAFYLSMSASGVDVESWGFQREQVKLSLWAVGILIVVELPTWLSVL